jgi:hypothetical protein
VVRPGDAIGALAHPAATDVAATMRTSRDRTTAGR